jgi:hypothetical protein
MHAWKASSSIVVRAHFRCHVMQATMLKELSMLNPLTQLRRLHICGCAADPRLDWLNLGHNVLVMTS